MDNMDGLRGIANELGLKIKTTVEAPAWPGPYAYLVELCGSPGEVFAQGYGATMDAAIAACLADWERPYLQSPW